MSTDPIQNVTNGAIGNPLSTENRVLETGAALVQVRLFSGFFALHKHIQHAYLHFITRTSAPSSKSVPISMPSTSTPPTPAAASKPTTTAPT